jgi:tetratricopeptide (TPR) repeat protein
MLTDPGSYWITHQPEMCIGIAMHTNKLYSLDLPWYKKAYERYRDDPRMAFNYAMRLIERNRVPEAMALFQELFDHFPYYAPPLGKYYELFEASGNHEKAMVVIERLFLIYQQDPASVTSRFPRNQIEDVFKRFAQYCYEKKKFNYSMAVLTELERLTPQDSRIWFNKALLFFATSEYEAAGELCSRFLQVEHDFPQAYLLYGEILKHQGKTAAAAQVYKQGLIFINDPRGRAELQQKLAEVSQPPAISGK